MLQLGLVVLAVLALTFSFFRLAEPVRASHVDGATVQLHQDLGDGVSGENPGEFAGDESECEGVEEGTTLFHFVANGLAEGTIANESELHAIFEGMGEVVVSGYYPSGSEQPTVHFDVVVEGDATLLDAWAVFNVDQTEDAKLLLSHICGGGEGEVEADLTLVKQDAEGGLIADVGFTLEGGTEMFTDATGQILFEDLTEGEWTLTETTAPEGCESGGTLTITVDAEGNVSVTDDDETDTLVIVSFDAETNTLTLRNDCEDGGEENGFVEIDKLFCDSDEGTRTEIEVNDPIEPGATAQTFDAPEDGCEGGVAHFTIYAADEMGDPVGDPVLTTSTDATGTVTFELSAGDYVIVEDSSGASAWFTVEAGMLTIIEVTNFVDDEEENGQVEIDKLFCDSDEGTRTEIEVNDPIEPGASTSTLDENETGCEGGVAHFTIYAADEEGNPVGDPVLTTSTDETGSVTFELPAGDYVIVEDSSGESAWFSVEAGMLTIIEVTNFESGLVKILKHNCDGTEDAVLFSIDGSEVTGFDPDTCVDGTGTFQIDDGDAFVVEGEAVVFATVGSHTLSELSPMTGTSPSFEVEFAAEGELSPITTIHVFNVSGPEGGEEETGQVKVLKHSCTGDEDAVLFSIDGSAVSGFDPDTCVDGSGTFQIDDGDSFTVDGEAVVTATVGSHTLSELTPMTGTSPSFEVELDAITTIHVFNVTGEDVSGGGEQPGGEQPGGNGDDGVEGGVQGGQGGPGLPDTATQETGGLPAGLLALLVLAGVGGLGAMNAQSVRRRIG
jgi:hypothetical protein